MTTVKDMKEETADGGSVDLEEFDFEDQGSIGRDGTRDALPSIGVARTAHELRLLTDAHLDNGISI